MIGQDLCTHNLRELRAEIVLVDAGEGSFVRVFEMKLKNVQISTINAALWASLALLGRSALATTIAARDPGACSTASSLCCSPTRAISYLRKLRTGSILAAP